MKPIVNEFKHKILSTLIVSIGAFLGFQAVSYIIGIYQLQTGILVAFYVYAFHIFWLTFLFDLHLKKRGILGIVKLNYKGAEMVWEACKQRTEHLRNWDYLRHYQNYLVLPGLLYWSTVILIFLNPFSLALKEFLVISSTLAMSVAYWFMKEHVTRKLEHQDSWIKVLALVKLFAAFLVYSAVIGTGMHYGYDIGFLLPAVITLTFLLVYQALFQLRLLTFSVVMWTVVLSFIMGFVSVWVYQNWTSEYFTGGLVMLAVYNTLWGMLHHFLEKNLTKKLAFEYLAIMVLIISLLFASHNFNQRII